MKTLFLLYINHLINYFIRHFLYFYHLYSIWSIRTYWNSIFPVPSHLQQFWSILYCFILPILAIFLTKWQPCTIFYNKILFKLNRSISSNKNILSLRKNYCFPVIVSPHTVSDNVLQLGSRRNGIRFEHCYITSSFANLLLRASEFILFIRKCNLFAPMILNMGHNQSSRLSWNIENDVYENSEADVQRNNS